jgi:hypothetical protein
MKKLAGNSCGEAWTGTEAARVGPITLFGAGNARKVADSAGDCFTTNNFLVRQLTIQGNALRGGIAPDAENALE